MRIAVVQFTSGDDPDANRRAVDARLGQIDDADLVVLPEAAMSAFGPADHDLAAVAEPIDGPFVAVLAQHATRLGATVVAGMFETNPDGHPFNTVVAVDPAGVRAAYRKIHLFDSFGYRESDRLAAGDVAPVVVTVGDLQVGLLTCYDLRFPELARALIDAGAEMLLVPAAWFTGEGKVEQWRTLLAARAIENVAPVVGAAQSGAHYCGHSLVVGPTGTIVAEAEAEEETLVVDVLAQDITAARTTNPSLANRRMPSTP